MPAWLTGDIYVAATVLVDAKLFLLYAARFPVLAGVPLGAVAVALLAMWTYSFQTYRRVQKARSAGASAADYSDLAQHYKSQMQRLMVPTSVLVLLLAASNLLRV